MKHGYKYIFWDFDGTIMDTYPGIVESLKYAMDFFGQPELDEPTYRTFIGPPLRDRIPAVYPLSELQTEVAVEKYREHYMDGGGMLNCRPFSGVLEAVEAFRKAGYMQVITTSKPEPMVTGILKRQHLEHLFDHVIGASLDGKIDTKQEVLEEAFRKLGVTDRNEVILIGDTKYDAVGARDAGIGCIGITYGFGSRQELEENAAEPVFDSIEEVVAYLS